MVMKVFTFRYPLALERAAWKSPLSPSSRAFDSSDSHLRRMRGRCSLNVFKALRTGPSRSDSLASSSANAKNLVVLHLAACRGSACRTQRNNSLTRNAVAVASPRSYNSFKAASCFSVRLVSSALSTAQREPFGSLNSLASNRRTSSRARVNSWTTWNQSTVTAAFSKVFPAADKKAGDMSQTTSMTLSGLPCRFLRNLAKVSRQA